jgi:hypothetical protein
MKAEIVIVIFARSLSALAQGTFENFNFEEARRDAVGAEKPSLFY